MQPGNKAWETKGKRRKTGEIEKAVNRSWIRQYDQVKKRGQSPGDDRHDSEEPQVVKRDGRVFHVRFQGK